MSKRSRFSILTLLALAIFANVSLFGCSFKKNPTSDINTDTTKPQQAKDFQISDYNFISDDQVIQTLDSMNQDQLLKIGAVDWAIEQKKQKILIYLLENRDISPFSYSPKSAQLLSIDSLFSSTIESFQEPHIFKILETINKKNSPEEWDKELSNKSIQTPGCLSIFQKMMNIYLYNMNLASRSYFPEISQKDVIDSYKGLTGTRVCHNLKGQIPSILLSNWYSGEVRKQYDKKFESIALIELFNTIENVQNISIDAYANGQIIRIDPRLLLFAALPLRKKLKMKELWIKELTPHINQSPFFYYLKYNAGDVGSECDKDDPYCEALNYDGIAHALHLLTLAPLDIADPSEGDVEDTQ